MCRCLQGPRESWKNEALKRREAKRQLRKAAAAAAAAAGDKASDSDGSDNDSNDDSEPELDDAAKARAIVEAQAKLAKEVTTFKFIDGFGPMLCAQYVAGNHLAVVEMPWIHAAKKLPDPVYRQRFGT